VAFELGTIPAEQALRNTVGDRFEFANILPPTGPDGRIGTMNVGNQFMMNSKAKHPDETWGLLKSLVSKEAAVRGALETMEPGRRSAWLDPRVVEKIPLYKEGAAAMDSSLEGFPMPWNLRYVEANNVFLNEAGLIWQGDKTWEEQAPVVEQKVQEIVDLDRP
jgi:ABC-type glycerol-3-phosphate transport system substrate-binding protein